MHKSAIAFSSVWLGLSAVPASPEPAPCAPFKEESVTIEYAATKSEAALTFEAESEDGVHRVEIRDPLGVTIARMRSQDGRDLALSGFVLESRECSFGELQGLYPQGVYGFVGRTAGGRVIHGSALLSHALPTTPQITAPPEGATGVPVNADVSWAAQGDAVAYRIHLEQDDNDGLTVRLPADARSFHVPDGVLQPDTETRIEVGAVGANGNTTTVEIVVWTD